MKAIVTVTVTIVLTIMHLRNVHAALRSQRNVRYNSIHSAGIEEVHDVPLSVIIRPFQAVLEEPKLASLMDTIQVREQTFPNCRNMLVIFKKVVIPLSKNKNF